MKRSLLCAALLFVATSASLAQQGSSAASPLAGVLNSVQMRNIGPFRSGAWVTSLAVPDAPARDHLYTIYAGVRSGGLWKTSNNGVTWEPVTDSVGTIASVGAVAVAPSNSQIVWVGGGDQANARSSMSGDGVFKSTDAGKTWRAMGLPDSHHIARILIPETPTSYTWPRWVTCSQRTKSEVCFAPWTAAPRGRRCSTSTTAWARLTW
jgi:hypothetical protein